MFVVVVVVVVFLCGSLPPFWTIMLIDAKLHAAECSSATVDPVSVCGNYQSDRCRASTDGLYNIVTAISFSGDDVGQFVKKVTL